MAVVDATGDVIHSVDLRAAFDSVDRNGIPPKLADMFKDLYTDTERGDATVSHLSVH